LCLFGDFLEGKWMTQEILGEAFAPGAVVGGDGFFAAVVDVEAGMFPEEEVGKEQFRIHMRMMVNFWNSSGEGGCGA
jgi:hypothetical protein